MKRTLVLIGSLTGLLAIALYPIAVQPKLHPEKWRERQRTIRDEKSLEETQPGGMKVWQDPFDRKKK